MKNAAFLLLAPLLGTALGTTLLAQDITGNWQGTTQPPQGPALRLVLKISLENDKWKALAYSIDRNPQPIPATAITRNGPAVKISFSAIAGGYEGKLDADGNSIAGTWKQDSLTAPLRLTRATPERAWAIPEPPPPPKNMRADVDPGIEVATVKPSRPDEGFGLGAGQGGPNVFSTTGTTVRTLIQFANGVHPRQITGPGWIDSERYDVTIKADQEGSPNIPQERVLMQKLLADRFKIVTHREKKELSLYALTVAKGGPKLAAHPGPPSNQWGYGFGLGSINGRNSTMTEFAGWLQANLMEQPVVDRTGLTDRYDFSLRYTPDPSMRLTNVPNAVARPTSDADALPDLFTAFQQQLGLKLESTRGPADIVVVDSIERPSEN
jgi:uncharacterized protein (TIGR03435 family)